MHGNVWEWCSDYWTKTYAYNLNADSEQSERPLRGGAWYFLPEFCRSAARDKDTCGSKFDTIGFRVVCDF